MKNIKLELGERIFQAALYENAATTELMKRLPMTITMEDLHGNEKYHYLKRSLPTNTANIGRINTGDIMLYGNNCLVLFYQNFSTSFTYTRLGYIDDVSELVNSLGNGDIVVTISECEK